MTYVYQPTNPLASFTEGFGVIDAMRQRRTQVQDQEAKAARTQQMQQQLANLRTNPSPQAIADFQLNFPEMKEGVDGYFKTLSEAKKATQAEASQRIIMAQRTGGDVAGILDEYAAAAENANDQATAKEFRDAATFAKQNPEAAAETARLRLAFTDPDAYKLIYDNTMYDTPFLKELAAAGIKPGSTEWNDALAEKRNGDPWVAVAGVGLFLKKDLEGMASGDPEAQATPTIPEEAAKFLMKNPNLAPDFDQKYGVGAASRILGGAASNGSGTFRGLPGEQVTSTYRDLKKNASVGGVPNSYHTKKDAQGRPLARDSVPPKGMSMAAYAAELRRLNPDMQVINEGDHVHMEPR